MTGLRRGCAVAGLLLALAGAAWGQDSLNVTKVGEMVDSGMQMLSVAVAGDIIYIGSSNVALQSYDIGDPLVPVQIGGFPAGPGNICHIEVRDTIGYFAAGYYGLFLGDVRDPAEIVEISRYDGSGPINWVELVGNLAYVCAGYDGLRIIDISDPGNLVEIGAYDPGQTYTNYKSLCVVDTLVFVTTWLDNDADIYGQLLIFDVSEVSAPALLSTSTWWSPANAVMVSSPYAYVACQSESGEVGWIRIFNVQNPAQPVEISALNYDEPPMDLALADNHLLAGTRIGPPWQDLAYLSVFDIQIPDQPVVAGYYRNDQPCRSLAVRDSLVYAVGGIELSIFAIGAALPVAPEPVVIHPSAFTLHPCHPNPFNPATLLRYDLPAPARVTLQIFDTAGRRVAALVQGPQPAGCHQARFDGAGLASGVYLARLQAGEYCAMQKLVLVK